MSRKGTPAIAWPYALAKRFKAYAVVYAAEQGSKIIARGGRIAANALTRNAAGDYALALDPVLQNDGVQILATVIAPPGNTPPAGSEISASVSLTLDEINVVTTASGEPFDLCFTVWVAEALQSEKVNDWPGPN